MPSIANIPQAMVDEHVAWHMQPGNPGAGGRVIDPWPSGATDAAPGSGEEFLVWHEGYTQRFHQWVAGLPNAEQPAANTIAPWTTIPIGLKMGMVGWNSQRAAQEAQLADMSNFATLDDLGRFLEWGLHGWLHGASASMWSEPILTSFESPRSTYFWQLHGLIDHWRQEWVDAQAVVPPISAIDRDLLREIRELLRSLRFVHPWPVPPRPIPGPDPAPLVSESEVTRLLPVLRELREMREI